MEKVQDKIKEQKRRRLEVNEEQRFGETSRYKNETASERMNDTNISTANVTISLKEQTTEQKAKIMKRNKRNSLTSTISNNNGTNIVK